MQHYKSYNGFEVFTENDSNKFVICMDTPDGMIRCNSSFTDYAEVTKFIDSGIKKS